MNQLITGASGQAPSAFQPGLSQSTGGLPPLKTHLPAASQPSLAEQGMPAIRLRGLPIGIGALFALVAIAAVGLSQVLQERMSRHLVEKVLESQRQRINDRVSSFDGTLRNAEASVRRFADLISFRSVDLQDVSGSLEEFAQRDPDGSWRLPRSRFDPEHDSNLWVPPMVPLSEHNQRFFLRANTITRIFGLGAQNAVIENAWMLPLVGGMTAFWPTNPSYLYNASSSLDYRHTPWVTLTDPKRNPAHEPRWVGPEYDPAARDWSISVVAPFFQDGRWAGSVGHDMRASRLLGKLIDSRDAGREGFSRPLFVATRDGHVLAKRDGAPSKGETVPSGIWQRLRASVDKPSLAVVPNAGNYLVMAPIPTLHAVAVYMVDGGWIRQAVSEELRVLQLAEGLFILVSVGSLVGFVLKDAQSRCQQQWLLEQRNSDLEQVTHIDQLTQLPNRLGLQERAEAALERARLNGHELMVAFLDLDRFKTINDSLGHAAGDALLVEVARRLRSALGSTGTVARLGGDEFVVVCDTLDDASDSCLLAERLHRSFRDPIKLRDRELAVSSSIGASIFPTDANSFTTLMRQADLAMYEVKNRGRNGWLFFTESMNQTIQERLSLEVDLRQSLDQEEFHLHYQPQWDIDGQHLLGWEALLRWCHPRRGAVSPSAFIPVAEDTGLINPLGEWVLRQACHQAARWQDEMLQHCRISVNISCRQFAQPQLYETIAAILQETGLAPGRLELEITESVLMEDPQRAVKLLGRLKEHGILIAIDDFGTGYSSLSYLRSFPIDRLKIDRSFVSSSLSDPSGAAIVAAIISLARSLGITTIAEGVESEEQRCFLSQRGCDALQGFLLGAPIPAEAIPAYLLRHPGSSAASPPRP
ncbi:MAG: EAL domain-containing protein [Cyanobium sp.]